MGRRIGYVLVFVGLFLLFFGLFDRFYAYPRLQKAPLDRTSKPTAPGAGSYFDQETLKPVEGASLENIRTVRGDVHAGTGKTAVWDTFSATIDTNTQKIVVPTVQSRIAFDRVTGEAKACCGEDPAGHQGLFFKFPFNAKKASYQFWDDVARQAFPVDYKGTEEVAGLSTYRFEQDIRDAKIGQTDLPGSLVGQPQTATVSTTQFYNDHKTFWVEPRTGIIISAKENTHIDLRTDDGRSVLNVIDGNFTYDDATVSKFANEAKKAKFQLNLLGTTIPFVGLALGIVLIVFGVVLAGRNLRREDVALPERRPAGAV